MTLNQQVSSTPIFLPTQRQKDNSHEQPSDSRQRFDER